MLLHENAQFIFSGEVLGQRPFSQNKDALERVSRNSGFHRLLLRPLSAQLLPVTLPEEKGWVDRSQLGAISGRSRKQQILLAREFGFNGYPTPAGGCLLTDIGFSSRLKDLLAHSPIPSCRDIELLKVGRHFRLSLRQKLVVGRDKRENQIIHNLACSDDMVFSPVDVKGPIVLAPNGALAFDQDVGSALCAAYCDAPSGTFIRISVARCSFTFFVLVRVPTKETFREFIV
jgi:tRNA-uridine 2-sulfurtransferase